MAGRPEKPIDWDLVDKLIEYHCTAEEIAGNFDLDRTNFYDRIEKKHGVNFTTYASTLRCKGKSKLRTKQWQKAEEGDVKMLLKLGELYLDQAQVIDSDIKVTINDARSNCTTSVQMPTVPGQCLDGDAGGC